MDKNDGTVKQLVPSEISGTIQIKYNLCMNKNVRCKIKLHHIITWAYLFLISLPLNVKKANKPNKSKMCAENMISHQINQVLLWETEYVKSYILWLYSF